MLGDFIYGHNIKISIYQLALGDGTTWSCLCLASCVGIFRGSRGKYVSQPRSRRDSENNF